jgi:hypothetical protein
VRTTERAATALAMEGLAGHDASPPDGQGCPIGRRCPHKMCRPLAQPRVYASLRDLRQDTSRDQFTEMGREPSGCRLPGTTGSAFRFNRSASTPGIDRDAASRGCSSSNTDRLELPGRPIVLAQDKQMRGAEMIRSEASRFVAHHVHAVASVIRSFLAHGHHDWGMPDIPPFVVDKLPYSGTSSREVDEIQVALNTFRKCSDMSMMDGSLRSRRSTNNATPFSLRRGRASARATIQVIGPPGLASLSVHSGAIRSPLGAQTFRGTAIAPRAVSTGTRNDDQVIAGPRFVGERFAARQGFANAADAKR